jgi:hypothetical protein
MKNNSYKLVNCAPDLSNLANGLTALLPIQLLYCMYVPFATICALYKNAASAIYHRLLVLSRQEDEKGF